MCYNSIWVFTIPFSDGYYCCCYFLCCALPHFICQYGNFRRTVCSFPKKIFVCMLKHTQRMSEQKQQKNNKMDGHIHTAKEREREQSRIERCTEQMKFKQEMISNWFFSAFLWFIASIEIGWWNAFKLHCSAVATAPDKLYRRIEFAFRLTAFKYRISYKFLLVAIRFFSLVHSLSLLKCNKIPFYFVVIKTYRVRARQAWK